MLQHSHVVNVYQFYKDDPNYYFMVMEYMAGGELFDSIVKKVCGDRIYLIRLASARLGSSLLARFAPENCL